METYNKIYVITNEDTTIEDIEICLKNNVKWIQIRKKKLSYKDLMSFCMKVKKLKKTYDFYLIINDYMDLCLQLNLDGIHIGQSELKEFESKKENFKNKIVGISVQNMDQARNSFDDATYFGVGSLFDTSTKLDAIKVSKKITNEIYSLGKKIVVIGGINKNTESKLNDYNFDCIALISSVFNGNIEKNVKYWNNYIDKYYIQNQKYGHGFYNTNIIKDNKLIRISNKNNDIVDRINEKYVINTIKKSNFTRTKEIIDYYDDNVNTYFVTKFINGTNFVGKEISRDNISSLVSTIELFHKINIKDTKIKIFDVYEINEKYNMNYESDKLKYLNNRVNNNLVLSHNDISRNNSMIDEYGNVLIIDFEYTTLNDNLFDYAQVIFEFKLSLNKKKIIFNKLNLEKSDINTINEWIDFIDLMWDKHNIMNWIGG